MPRWHDDAFNHGFVGAVAEALDTKCPDDPTSLGQELRFMRRMPPLDTVSGQHLLLGGRVSA
jgi:hypothetical protein